MVTINVSKKKLLELVGENEEKVLDALPQIKCNVDKEENGVLALEITGDRPDLLSLMGVVRGLKGFFSSETGLPSFKAKPSGVNVIVDSLAQKIRPVIVGAVIEGVSLDEDEIADLFATQEKLDLTNGRRRKKVSIGLYDLEKLTPPFYYKAVDGSLAFHPLKSEKKMTVKQILSDHETGKNYSHLLSGNTFPVLMDSNDEVLSLIPIINGISSSVTSKTKKLFIDHTGTDFAACNHSLNILCQDFADLGCKVKTVEIVYPEKTFLTPDFAPQLLSLKTSAANKLLGFNLPTKQIIECLAKQRIAAKEKKGILECLVPAYRPDFLHPVDLVEEIALGYGFNSFEPKSPSLFTTGSRSDYSILQQQYREALIGAGLTEVMSYVLTSPEKAGKAFSENDVVGIKNPVSTDYCALRSSLLPNLLEVLSKNTDAIYPQKIFEIGEVVVKDSKTETKTRTDLHCCALIAHKDASFTEAASLAVSLMKNTSLRSVESKKFIQGRTASMATNNVEFGIVGEISPQVLENYKLFMPVSAFEFKLRTGVN